MSLFRLTLDPLSTLQPWERRGIPTLSWFALTLGHFWIDLEDVELFRYSPGILDVWGRTDPYADYQVAAFAQDLLGSAALAMAPLPPRVESLAVDWPGLCERRRESEARARRDRSRAARDLEYRAWRWLGERSPWMSYLTEEPRFSLVRLSNPDRVRIGFDNRDRVSDGVPVWTATIGHVDFEVGYVESELRGFASRLLAAMAERIDDLATGRAVCLIPVDVASLRAQHETWAAEVEGYFAPRRPDISWEETVEALETLVGDCSNAAHSLRRVRAPSSRKAAKTSAAGTRNVGKRRPTPANPATTYP